MRVRVRGRWIGLLALLSGMAALGTLRLRPAAAEDPGPVDVPAGAVAFFAPETRTCPQGWRPATEASGRLLVGVAHGDFVGKLVGQPLASQEDRTHSHPFSLAIELPYKSISAADGGNRQGAAAKKYQDSGMSGPAPSGLPFVQLVACVKQ
jgi:hypothetical protein